MRHLNPVDLKDIRPALPLRVVQVREPLAPGLPIEVQDANSIMLCACHGPGIAEEIKQRYETIETFRNRMKVP